MQRESSTATTGPPADLAAAIFEWIEGWYNPRHPHTGLGDHSLAEIEKPSHRRQ